MGGCRRTSKNDGERTSGTETVVEKIGCRAIASRNRRSRCAGPGAENNDPNRARPWPTTCSRASWPKLSRSIREINENAERPKELKEELIAEARRRESDLASTDGGGTRWTTEGSDGCIARVTFPAPTLKAKIDQEGKVIEKIKSLAGAAFTSLFVPATRYRPVERFREKAAVLLPETDANKLITPCQSASAPRVSFETTEREAA
jgi:hypothetical protein